MKVVICYNLGSCRRLDEREYLYFEASGAVEEADLVGPVAIGNASANGSIDGVEVESVEVCVEDRTPMEADDDSHLGLNMKNVGLQQ